MTPHASPGSHRWRWATLAILCVTLLLVSIDLTILTVALPSIVNSLHASSSQLQWIIDAYAIALAGLLLTLGALGDRIGRKWVFLAGLLVFAAGSALSAFAGSAGWLIAGRVVMGLGAAALMPGTLSILTNVFSTDRDRGRAIGIWSATTGLGVAIGPILGGFLLAHYWWGSVFLINVPIAALGAVAAIFLVPNSRSLRPKKLDPVGMLLSILGFGLLLWAIIEAPSRSWSAPPIAGALAASAVLIAGFIVWEHRRADPMLPVSFFRNWRRLAEQDRGHVEHRLQGALALGPLQANLGLAEFAREYPAWRADHRPGFIDFLGLDRQNRLHVVETKVNPDDVTTVLQTLDYAIWVQANAKKIRDERRWPESGGEEKSVA